MSDPALERLWPLVRRAAGLDERLAAGGPRALDLPASLWAARWAEEVARGDAAAFARRLAWDGWSADQLGWLACDPVELPRWARLLGELAAGQHPDGSAEPALPFGAIAAPAARLFAREVAAAAPAGWARLTPPARADLARALAQRLLAIAEPTLEPAWEAFRLAAGAPADAAEAPAGDALFAAFTAGWTGPALLEALAAVPVLGRLWGLAIEQAIDAAREALDRLAADADLLARHFGPAAAAPIATLAAALSDAHGGGRTVWRLETVAGAALYYKPRSLAMDAAWPGFVAWLADQGLAPALRAPDTLDRGDYGWVAAVEQAPVADDPAARRFFRRMGALVAIAHALGASDLHAENLVAAGEHPVLVDLETLIPPRLDAPDGFTPFANAAALGRQIDAGVFDSLLVTWPTPFGENGVADLAPLADPLPDPAWHEAAWDDANTDRMRRGQRPGGTSRHHLAMRDGQPLRARDFGEEVLAGFDAAYALLLARREALRDPAGPLAAFADAPVRLLFRQTRHYAKLQGASWKPERVADGRARSIGFDLLARTYLRQPERPALWPIIGAERRALERLDFPYVAGRTGSRDLLVEGTRLSEALPLAPIDAARARIAALSPADHALQRAALALALGRTRADRAAGPEPLPGPLEPLAAAAAIGERLRTGALRTADGGATWLARLPYGKTRHQAVGVLGAGLWDGALGPALFLAALAEATGDAPLRELARAAAIGPRLAAGRAAAVVAAGGASAAAGMAYGLARLAPHLADEALTLEALALAAAIDPAAIAATDTPDVLGGLAGAVLALLGVHAATGDQRALAQAQACGEALLAMREPAPSGELAWRGALETFPAGYGHGQAGIADALLRLAARTGDARLREAAHEALLAEAARFVPSRGDWRVAFKDEPAGGGPWFMAGWCHGAPGMVLGRLAARELAPRFADELEVALAATAALGPHAFDFACCGTAGRVEAWLEAATALGRPELAARALAAAAAMPGLAAPATAEDVDPRYLKGMASVGWALLRLADPSRPCLLVGA